MERFRRYELIQAIVPLLGDETLVVSNIGFPSQELYGVKDAPTHFWGWSSFKPSKHYLE